MSEAERAAASAAICSAASGLLASRLARGATVALYAAKGSEVDAMAIDRWARAHGMVVAYPRVVADTRRLAFHAVAPEALAASRFGLREPSPDAPAVALASIAAFVVPGLAFDRRGGRIGWGRGYYDATFAAAPPDALRVGLGFACQVVDDVAREAHDVALDFIITEVATHVVA